MDIDLKETWRIFFFTRKSGKTQTVILRENATNCTLAAVESISGRILQVNTYKLNIHFSRKFLNKYLL